MSDGAALLDLWVEGEPIPQPRPRIGTRNGFAHVYRDDSHPIHAFRQHVQLLARQQYGGDPWTGPVGIEMTFVMPRPQNMIRRRKAMPRAWHKVRPDADNLAKGVLDSIKGIVFKDDGQVADCHMRKLVAAGGEQPGVRIVVTTLGDVP